MARFVFAKALGSCMALANQVLGGAEPVSKLRQVLVRDVATQSQCTYTAVRASPGWPVYKP
eukprot:8579214-Alexandrium_andersonii.AAC.1